MMALRRCAEETVPHQQHRPHGPHPLHAMPREDRVHLLEHGPVTFELSESLTLGTINPHEYPVWTSLATRSLSSAQYQKIIEAVSAVLNEVEPDEGEKLCTLAFVAFQGRGAM